MKQVELATCVYLLYWNPLLIYMICFHFNMGVSGGYFWSEIPIQSDVNNSSGRSDHFCLFTYVNSLLITCAFRFNIHDLFVYFFKMMSTTASQVTTCFYLLMQITCWLHVFFVLIFMIYLFTSSKWCQQQHRKSPPVFIYLCKWLVDYMCF